MARRSRDADWLVKVEFGDNLQKLRKRAGLTQQALAEKARISVSAVFKLEQGKVDPGWTTVMRLAKALRARVSEFVYGPRKPEGKRKKG
jgi:transcriptional regulator with XRE-family HTH domain